LFLERETDDDVDLSVPPNLDDGNSLDAWTTGFLEVERVLSGLGPVTTVRRIGGRSPDMVTTASGTG
jgi:hypothetical protein